MDKKIIFISIILCITLVACKQDKFEECQLKPFLRVNIRFIQKDAV